MKKYLLSFAATFFLLISHAQTEAEMKAWQAYMTPGEMHKRLASTTGVFRTEVIMWTAPGTEPMKSTGSAKNEMILGGRYLQTNFKGDFMGMPMEGSSITAYDNAKKIFLSTWIDNFGSGIMIMEGKWNAANNAIEFSGKMTDPTTGRDIRVREQFTIKPDGSQFMEMWAESADGKEFKNMEIRYFKEN